MYLSFRLHFNENFPCLGNVERCVSIDFYVEYFVLVKHCHLKRKTTFYFYFANTKAKKISSVTIKKFIFLIDGGKTESSEDISEIFDEKVH